jgi:hypothetical protein
MAEPPPAEVQGHGTLSAFHDGCRCGWCESRCWERGCICPTCVELRATSPYIEIPEGEPPTSSSPYAGYTRALPRGMKR